MEISVPYAYLLVPVLSAVGLLGSRRGWAREAVTFVGVMLAWLVMARLGEGILQLLNRLARAVLFILEGGMESGDPASLVRRLNQTQLADQQHPEVPLAILFVVLVLVVYLVTSRLIMARTTILAKIGGALLAALNGYIITFVILQEPSPRSTVIASVALPMGDAPGFLGQYLSAALVALVGVVIVFALFSGIRLSRRSAKAGWAEKRRS
ncbi:MAG: hypothetical protein HYY30_02350 [Chloroflexi bacterium]|nr:hypothetical protein [Chloroflexota bacterium]